MPCRRYLAPYRVRATVSVGLVILSSILEIAGPAIIAVAIDLYVKPMHGATAIGISQRVGLWLTSHGWSTTPLTGIDVAAGLYFLVLIGNFAVLYTQMVLMNLMGQFIQYDLRKQIFESKDGNAVLAAVEQFFETRTILSQREPELVASSYPFRG